MIHEDEHEASWYEQHWPDVVIAVVISFAVVGVIHLGMLIAQWMRI